jgi:hypothetical protein
MANYACCMSKDCLQNFTRDVSVDALAGLAGLGVLLGWRHYQNRLSAETYRLFNNERADSIAGRQK